MTNCIIKTNNNMDQCGQVIKLAVAAGYNTLRVAQDSSIVCGEWFYGDGKKQMLQGDYERNVEYKPGWPRFDAATDMARIKDFFAGKYVQELTIENIVQGRLLDLIRNNPGNELVVGFIRRDLKLALPKDVQDAGADAICAWIMENKKADSAVAAAKKTMKFNISLEISESGSWYRNDAVDYEGEVPQDVVDRAKAENDYEIIEDWLIGKRSELKELNREYGDSSDGDQEGSTYEGIPEDPNYSVENQFDELMGR